MNSFQKISDKLSKHWAINLAALLVFAVGATYAVINYSTIQPLKDQIQDLKSKPSGVINVFNYNNNVIKIPELTATIAGEPNKEQIANFFRNAEQKIFSD